MTTINKYALATELLMLKARISIVAQETGLPLDFLRRNFHEIHHKSPSSGPNRTSPVFICKSLSKHKESTLYGVFFRLETDPLTVRRAINAYKRYCAYLLSASSNTHPQLSFSEAWVIASWLNSGAVKLVRCRHCRSAKLFSEEIKYHPCCVCKT